MAKGGVKTIERAAFLDWWFDVERRGTQGMWAETNNVHFTTVSEWKRSAEFLERQHSYRTIFHPDFVEATMAMLRKAKAGDVSAYIAVRDVLGEKVSEKVEITAVQRVSYVDPGALRSLGTTLAIAAESIDAEFEPVDN